MRKQISRIFGQIAAYKFPKFIQKFINNFYVKHFEIPMDEFKNPGEYESLLALFTRRLERERKLENGFISPSDGVILHAGISDEFKAFSIKGKEYFTHELLGEKLPNLRYANIYLSPKDYHNYHAPTDMKILSMKYFCAELFSVNIAALKKHENLYSRNERVCLKCERMQDGAIFYMVFVGAVNVGKMQFDFDTSIETNMKNAKDYQKDYQNITLKKGQMLGRFLMGSTILLLSETVGFDKCEQRAVKYGEKLLD